MVAASFLSRNNSRSECMRAAACSFTASCSPCGLSAASRGGSDEGAVEAETGAAALGEVVVEAEEAEVEEAETAIEEVANL